MNSLSELLKDLKTKSGQPVEIPFEGTLPLLALGDIGLLLWREKKKQVISSYQKNDDNAE